VSGSSLYTLGFSKPSGIGLIWVTFIEATLGLGLVALLISYLPTIYGAFNERERGIYVLAPFAGTPPSPEGLIQRMTSSGTLDNREFWNRMVEWLVDLDQSHTSFPALTYFPTRSPGQSWVASAGAMLEASALLLSTVDGSGVRALPGPILVLTYGRAALSSVGRAVGLDLPEPAPLVGLLAIGDGEPPPISVRREEYEAVIERLGRGPGADPDAAWHRYAWLRAGYDRALCGLAGLTEALPAPMTTDRPAHVGRPRLVSHRPLRVDWSEPPPGASS